MPVARRYTIIEVAGIVFAWPYSPYFLSFDVSASSPSFSGASLWVLLRLCSNELLFMRSFLSYDILLLVLVLLASS